MVHVRKSHAVVWAVAAALLAFLLLGSSFDLWPALIFAAAAVHFALNVGFSLRTRLRRPDRLARPARTGHQESSPAAMEEVFAEERKGSAFVLPVHLEGRVQGKNAEHAPWSGRECVGWDLFVEIYRKTALGGDSDFAPLAAVGRLCEFRLESDGAAVRVRPPGLVRGADARTKLLSWKALGDHPGLNGIVDEAMQLQKLSRGKYTGVRATETTVAAGDAVTVWGHAAKDGSGVAVGGTAAERDPEALLVGGAARPGPARGSGAALARLVASGVLSAGLLVLALVFAGSASWWKLEQSFPWANVQKVGTLHWTGNGKNYELACRTLNLSGETSWELGPEDDSVNLVSGNDKAVVNAATTVTVTRPRLSPFSVFPGAPSYPLFLGPRFLLTVPEMGVTAEQVSVHEGPLWVVNRSGGSVEIRFRAAGKRPELDTPYWTIVPGGGTTLVLDDKSFSLTEGDGVLLRRPGESASRNAFVALGGHPAAVWNAGKTRWVLTVEASTLVQRAGSLTARNPNPHTVKVDVVDGENTLGSWTLTAGFGGRDGQSLESDGRQFEFRDGYTLSVEPHADEVLYTGPIGSYGAASFKDGMWTVKP